MPIPAPLLQLVPLAIQGAKMIYTATQKPKYREPKELIRILDRSIANRESDIVNKTLMNQITSAQKSLGSRLYQQQARGLDVMRARGELSEGQHAQALMDAGTQAQTAVGEQTENAMLMQAQSNLEQQERIETARLKIAEMKHLAREQSRAETQQWRNELMGGALDTAAAGFNTYMTGLESKQLQDTVTEYLKSKGVQNIAELDDAGLNGLYITLILQKMGISALGTQKPKVNTSSEDAVNNVQELVAVPGTQEVPPVVVNPAAGNAPVIQRSLPGTIETVTAPFNPVTTVIAQGQEANYTDQQIQTRINYLINNIGWSSPELTRLVRYRDNKRKTK